MKYYFLLCFSLIFMANAFCDENCEWNYGIQENEFSFYSSEDPSHNFEIVPFLDLKWRFGGGRSYENGYETLEAFLIPYNPSYLSYPFLDLRFNRVGKGRFASNYGIGWRTYTCDYEEMWGANIYYDFRHLAGENLHQVGLGIELLGRCWDVRANGYLPVGNRKILLDTTFYSFSDPYFAERLHYRSAMWGLDVEFGKELFCNKCFTLYAGIGPYCYGSLCCHTLIGGMGRITAQLTKAISIRFYITHDRIFHTKAQGEISLLIPFSCKWDELQCLFNPVERNYIILAEDCCCWKANF